MAGIANSWIETYTTQAPVCASGSTPPSPTPTLSSCLVWLLVGLVLGGLKFQSKGSQQ